MAIDLKQSYIQKAHRLSLNDVDSSVTTIHAGQLFQLNNSGKWVYADGTRKAYPTLNNRYAGQGLGLQGEILEGRDDVSRAGKLACLMGNFEIGTDQYDTAATYTYGAALHPSTDSTKKGKVTMYDSTNVAHKAHLICGYVTHVPVNSSDMLRYQN